MYEAVAKVTPESLDAAFAQHQGIVFVAADYNAIAT
jgi:hypothetical protein